MVFFFFFVFDSDVNQPMDYWKVIKKIQDVVVMFFVVKMIVKRTMTTDECTHDTLE